MILLFGFLFLYNHLTMKYRYPFHKVLTSRVHVKNIYDAVLVEMLIYNSWPGNYVLALTEKTVKT